MNIKRVPREWKTYEYYDPKVILKKLQKIREDISRTDTPSTIRNLRTNKLKIEREAWDIAIFCYLMSKAIGVDILFSRIENYDYDSIFTWNDGNSQCFAPVQMKELVPEETNPTATLEAIIESLKKYVNSPELIIGIKLNRRIQFVLSSIECNDISVGEIWCFGATMADESRWSLFGDLLTEYKQQYEYELPNP
ncbi:MAG: hypothetical protein Q8Q54_06630 [Methylococcales bacterium]|nr:hypothetical protein [Methylococcales bacterium]MDP3838581.1 hypothetical protein [Methylococcales bacterium]